MTADWHPSMGFELLVARLLQDMTFASLAENPIPNYDIVDVGIWVLHCTGLFRGEDCISIDFTAFHQFWEDVVNIALLTSVNHLPEGQIVEIITNTVAIEKEFISDALPVVELTGMNSSLMYEYIEFCADRLLCALGCGCHYKVGSPFEWMETISLQGKTNF
jgi:hypothetical protein